MTRCDTCWTLRAVTWRPPDGARCSRWEALFHSTGLGNFLLPFRDTDWWGDTLDQRRLECAIGVVYRPEAERVSHFFGARLPAQFDAVIHWDETRAVEPLDPRGL